jgi:hypothetical protein
MSLTNSADTGVGLKTPSALRVVYGRTLKRVTLQRILTSKLVFFPDQVSYHEILVFYDNLIWLSRRASQDQDFRRKFGEDFESLSNILRTIRIEGRLDKAKQELSQRLRSMEGFYVPRRNFLTVWSHCKGKFQVVPYRPSGIPTKELKPKPYIGVGYKDKGTRRDPAYDGSPSWQEVAMDRRGER